MDDSKTAEVVAGAPAADTAGKSAAPGADRARLRDLASDSRQGKPRGPYKCRRCGRKHPAGSCNVEAPAAQALQPEPQRPPLFTPENTGRLVRLPFAVAALRVNCAALALDDEEEKELGTTGAVALNEWCAVDAKWVALGLFGVSLAGIAVNKILIYTAYIEQLRLRRAELEAKNRAAARVSGQDGRSAPPAPPAPEPEIPAEAPPSSGSPFGPSAIPPAPK